MWVCMCMCVCIVSCIMYVCIISYCVICCVLWCDVVMCVYVCVLCHVCLVAPMPYNALSRPADLELSGDKNLAWLYRPIPLDLFFSPQNPLINGSLYNS